MDMETALATRKNELKIHNVPKGGWGYLRAGYPPRVIADDNLDYDSNGSSSIFEFPTGERSSVHRLTRSGMRNASSKWSDAQKWIRSKQKKVNAHGWKEPVLQNHADRIATTSIGKINPKHSSLRDTSSVGSICSKPLDDKPSGFTTIREVSMRDMGTEMTPVATQEASRAATPAGSVTPLRSPASSIPSTPRRDAPAPTPMDQSLDEEWHCMQTEEELKLKTRREITALSAQLGKINIASWASKDEAKRNVSVVDSTEMEDLERLEFKSRAAAWAEAEKTKHTTRYKCKEIRIQAWESQQKAKLEAEMRRIEAQVNRMRARAQSKVSQKIETARQRLEEKWAAAEFWRKRDTERTAAQAERIRQTGRIPPSPYICIYCFRLP